MLTSISLEKSNFWIDPKGLLYCKHLICDKNWMLDSDEVKKHILAILTLACNKPRTIIIDFRDVHGFCSILSSRMFAKDHGVNKMIISEAFIINNFVEKLLIYAYKRIYEPTKPFKIFNNIRDAQEYSLKQLELVKESIKKNDNEVKSQNLIFRDISVG